MKKSIVMAMALLFGAIGIMNAADPITPARKFEPVKPFGEYYVGIGLAGVNIFDSNPAWDPINSRDVIGGSFDGVENGFSISAATNLDENSTWMLPFSFEWLFLSANEQYVRASYQKEFWNHQIDLQKISTGIQWNFCTFPFKDVRAYMGLEVKAVLVNNQELTVKYKNTTTGVLVEEERNYKVKDAAVRLGGEYKIGFRGELAHNLYLNVFAGYECLNLLGRDDNRGELLTPLSTYETEEGLVSGIHYNFIIEYKL
jgi:hypothetical protein